MWNNQSVLNSCNCKLIFESTQQQSIINGQTHIKELYFPSLVCSNCNTVIAKMASNIDAYMLRDTIHSELQGVVNYCRHCGKKLIYPCQDVFELTL